MKITKLYNESIERHGVEVETNRGFINQMWFENEPNLDDSEWVDYIHEEMKFREDMWIQSGRFKPLREVVVANEAEQVEEGTPSTEERQDKAT